MSSSDTSLDESSLTSTNSSTQEVDAKERNSSLLRYAFSKSNPLAACTREAMMWGIATGTAMGIHRFRMGSRLRTVSNFTFGTIAIVSAPSFYLCAKRREHHEKMIEALMKANDFSPAEEAPVQPSVTENHPFLTPASNADEATNKEIYVYNKANKYGRS